MGGTGRASKSLRRSTAAPEECGLGDVGAVVGGGVCNHRFPHDFRAADLPISDSKDSFIYQKWIAWDFFDKSQAEDAYCINFATRKTPWWRHRFKVQELVNKAGLERVPRFLAIVSRDNSDLSWGPGEFFVRSFSKGWRLVTSFPIGDKRPPVSHDHT